MNRKILEKEVGHGNLGFIPKILKILLKLLISLPNPSPDLSEHLYQLPGLLELFNTIHDPPELPVLLPGKKT